MNDYIDFAEYEALESSPLVEIDRPSRPKVMSAAELSALPVAEREWAWEDLLPLRLHHYWAAPLGQVNLCWPRPLRWRPQRESWAISVAGQFLRMASRRWKFTSMDAYALDAPYGGVRTDVGAAFPDVEGSENSGFSLAFNYSNLSSGTHTVSAIAHSDAGATKASAADFEVVRFASSFISDPNAVDLSLGSCSLASDEVTLANVTVDGSQHDLVMKWRRAEQGFELIQIEKSDDETAEAPPVALSAQQSNLVAQSDPVLRVVLEEPVLEEIHTGVGNLRGWAVADEGIEKVEIYIDGAYSFDAPYGGVRTDVRDAFPDVGGFGELGFLAGL